VAEVRGGDLQGVEHEARAFAVDLAGDQQAHDFGKRLLDGVGVLEYGQGEREFVAVTRAFGAKCEALFVPALVVVAETVVAHGGRAALGAIHHDVHAVVE